MNRKHIFLLCCVLVLLVLCGCTENKPQPAPEVQSIAEEVPVEQAAEEPPTEEEVPAAEETSAAPVEDAAPAEETAPETPVVQAPPAAPAEPKPTQPAPQAVEVPAPQAAETPVPETTAPEAPSISYTAPETKRVQTLPVPAAAHTANAAVSADCDCPVCMQDVE